MKTTASLKPAEVEKKWIVIDAEDARRRPPRFVHRHASSRQAQADYTPHVDCGDYVVVINADKVKFTGRKRDQKIYYRHTGYPGGIKERTAGKILDGRFPERVLEKAVERMLPKRARWPASSMSNLRIYNGAEHPHTRQNPEVARRRRPEPKNVSA